ncbi:hypothetical protein Ahy_B04g069663 isoform A [Arachis hypogaea]|uniref:DUF4283 domain-containing protein n=1 Tax=Arachis hypogaea TaxID=3818 RepID=A0A444ZD72_ARAHY|nr:hypothetical protein Ahy_B04g069663 isoform A [Arachis hypogaea]
MVADNLAGSTIPQKISYKETLLSSPGDAWEGNIVEVAEEEPNPEDRWYIDMEAQEKENKAFDPCPTIPVSKDEFDEWCKSWHAALIVKVLDKRVGLGFLEQRLNRDWAKKGKINVIDIDRDYFLVHFSYEKDYSHALLDGPWMIAGHYLIVQSEVAVHVEGSPKAGNVETPVEEKEGQPEGSITGDLTIQSKCANQGVNCVDQGDMNQGSEDESRFNVLIDGVRILRRIFLNTMNFLQRLPCNLGLQQVKPKLLLLNQLWPKKAVVPQSKPSTSKDPYKEDMEQVIMANMRGMVKQQWEDFNAMRNGNTSHGSNEATRSSGIRHCAHHPDPEDRGKSVIVGPAPEKPPDATLSCVTRTTGSQKNSVNRFLMNILTWNYWGAGEKTFPNLIRDLKRDYDLNFVILLETHISGDRRRTVRNRIGFNGMFVEDARGQSGGYWDDRKLREWLPDEVVQRVLVMAPPSPWKNEDQIAWALSSDGAFNLKSAYQSLHTNQNHSDQIFKLAWD